MGAEASTAGGPAAAATLGEPNTGFRVMSIQAGSPACGEGIVPFLDFIVEADGRPVEANFAQLVKEFEGRPLEITLYNCKCHELRKVTFVPHRNWGGDGLLGLMIKVDSYENAEERVLHVLDVNTGSPAQEAGLEPFTDYILGTPHQFFSSVDEFFEIISDLAADNADERRFAVDLYVYSTRTDIVRRLVIAPRSNWGGEGILGCGIGHGYLHRLPHQVQSTPGLARESDFITVRPKPKRQPLPTQPPPTAAAPVPQSPAASEAPAAAAAAATAAAEQGDLHKAADEGDNVASEQTIGAASTAHTEVSAPPAPLAEPESSEEVVPTANTAERADGSSARLGSPKGANGTVGAMHAEAGSKMQRAASSSPERSLEAAAAAPDNQDEEEEQEPGTIPPMSLVQTEGMGRGRLCGTKASGVGVIQLNWGLPNGATVLAFLQPSSFKQILEPFAADQDSHGNSATPSSVPSSGASPSLNPAAKSTSAGFSEQEPSVIDVNLDLNPSDADDLR